MSDDCRGLPLVAGSEDYPTPLAVWWFDQNLNDSSGNGKTLTKTTVDTTYYLKQSQLAVDSDLAYNGFGIVQNLGREWTLQRTDTDFNITGSMACMALIRFTQVANSNERAIIAYNGSGELEPENYNYLFRLLMVDQFRWQIQVFWEFGAGTNVSATTTTLFGMEEVWYVVGFRRTDNGDGTSDLSIYMNDLAPEVFAGLTSPSGGGAVGNALTVLDRFDTSVAPFTGACAQMAVWDQGITEAQYYAAVRRMLPRVTQP